MDVRIDVLEIVELIRALPFVGKRIGRRVFVVDRQEIGGSHVRVVGVAGEIGAGQFAIPRPIVFRVGGGVYAQVSATRLDEAFKIVLLLLVEHIAGGAQEDHGVVTLQVLFIEVRRILGGVYGNVVFFGHRLYGLNSRADGLVAESRSLGEDQDAVLVFGLAARQRQKHQEDGD